MSDATEKQTILVVDDTPENIDILVGLLSDDYRVKAAPSGEIALKLAATTPPPDLILLDVMMPGIDGYEVCAQLKASEQTRNIPVLFVTAQDQAHEEARGFELGAADYITKPIRPAVVQARVRTHLALYDQNRQLEQKVTARMAELVEANRNLDQEKQERDKAVKTIHHVRNYDQLTGLPNRSMFMLQLEKSLERSRRDDSKLAVIVANIDRFAAINDSLGTPRGDEVLQVVARRLGEAVRSNDLVAHLNADNFAIISQQADWVAGASSLAATRSTTRLLEAVGKPMTVGDEEVTVALRCGIALSPADGSNPQELLNNAEASMAHVKRSGEPERVAFYSRELNAHSQNLLQIEQQLRRALTNQELQPFFQPKLATSDLSVVGAEALVRWIDAEGNMISPGVFIPVAEECNLIKPLGDMMLRKTCEYIRDWSARFEQKFHIAVNLSPIQFRYPELVDEVAEIIRETGIDPGYLQLEITEQAVVDDPEIVVERMQALRNLGVSLALDDFGTGYSSLAHLSRFPVDELKVDQSFVRSLGDSDRDRSIVQTIIGLAGNLGMSCVAEGIENQTQLDFVRERGCDILQGFMFSKAVPAGDFEQFLAEPLCLAGQAGQG